MTKKEIAQAIAEEVGIPRVVVTKAVQRIFDGIIAELVSEGRIELRNFGVFTVRKRKARSARNPKTGKQVSIPERCVVTFKPGHRVTKRIRSCKDQ